MRRAIAGSSFVAGLACVLCTGAVAHDHEPVWAESPASIVVHTTGPTAVRGDGDAVMYLPTESVTGYAAVFIVESSVLFPDGGYCTAWAQRGDLARLAITNPLWLQHADPGDVDGNGIVDVADMLALIAAFGDCLGCPADTDGNGVVDVIDLLALRAGYTG